MKLPAVIVSDLHLTANPADAYRWGLFPWLAQELEAERAETLLILGDLTDAKDYHPAQLVNQIVKAIDELRKHVKRIVILRGNHDFLKDGHTFFEFLGALPGVEVITKPTEDPETSKLTMFLPYSKTPTKDWAGCDFSHYDYLFMHQTVKGSVASNGQKMEGEDLPPLNAVKVYSGDIHVPQKIGPVEYVGSPYHVHFGDRFKPRAIAIDRSGKAFDLHCPMPERMTLDVNSVAEFERINLRPGDQIKVRVHLGESEKHGWRAIRDEIGDQADTMDVKLCGLELIVKKARRRVVIGSGVEAAFDPATLLYRFVERDELGGDLLEAGLECLES